MNFSTVSSLVGHRSSRPVFFFPADFAKPSGVPNSSFSNFTSNQETGETLSSEKSFHGFGGFGMKLVGTSGLAKTDICDKHLRAEGLSALKLTMGDDMNTFQKQFSCHEKVFDVKLSSERDLPTSSFQTELCPRRKVSPPQVAESKTCKTDVPSISCSDLVAHMVDPESLVIIDCRNFMTYNANHVRGAVNVNLANKITRKRFIDGHITIPDLVSGADEKAEYKRKEHSAVIVVYDDNATNMESLPAAHPLKLLSNRLQSEGRNVKYLEGGLQFFQSTFRQFCQYPDAPPGVPLLYSPTSQDVDMAVDSATASEILPYLYVGNERDASNQQTLQELGITHILNVTAHIPFHFEDRLMCKRLQASDSGCQNLKQYFEEAIQFIETARISNGRVLIHCQAGVSRSPTICMAYLMARFQKSLQETFSYVHNRRSIISPNLNFMGQLLEFGQRTDVASLCSGEVRCPEMGKN